MSVNLTDKKNNLKELYDNLFIALTYLDLPTGIDGVEEVFFKIIESHGVPIDENFGKFMDDVNMLSMSAFYDVCKSYFEGALMVKDCAVAEQPNYDHISSKRIVNILRNIDDKRNALLTDPNL